MRVIRLVLFGLLALVLIMIGTANRGIITVSLVPEAFAPFVGGRWALNMPAFLALFLAMLFGVLVGLIWEWLRESRLRAEARIHANELAQLQREIGAMRRAPVGPKDEVLAILDEAAAQKSPAATAPATSATTTLPAPR